MKRIALATGFAAIFASPLSAEDIKPTMVSFADGAVEASLTGQMGDVAEGRKLINKGAGNCIACHNVSDRDDLAFHGEIGPPLDGAGDRWSEAELRGINANAKEMFPDTMMPSFYKTTGFIRPGNGFSGKAAEGELDPLLTGQQVENVVAYLMTLKE